MAIPLAPSSAVGNKKPTENVDKNNEITRVLLQTYLFKYTYTDVHTLLESSLCDIGSVL